MIFNFISEQIWEINKNINNQTNETITHSTSVLGEKYEINFVSFLNALKETGKSKKCSLNEVFKKYFKDKRDEQSDYKKNDKDTLLKQLNSKNILKLDKTLSEFIKRILQSKLIVLKKEDEVFWFDVSQNIIWLIPKINEVNPIHKKAFNVNHFPKNSLLGNEWMLPTRKQIFTLSRNEVKNIYLNNNGGYSPKRLFNKYTWLITENEQTNVINLTNEITSKSSICEGYVLFVHNNLQSIHHLLLWVLLNDVELYLPNDLKTNQMIELKQKLISHEFNTLLLDLDYNRCRLPKLITSQIEDINAGLWEFWGKNPDSFAEIKVRARNPALDVLKGTVGIDFGTSSTVVAYEDNHGKSALLRIGVDDFYKQPQPEHYENPTVLEFVDFNAFQRAWLEKAYQPNVLWDDVRCSHEALLRLRNNDNQPNIVSSILVKLKQWALREAFDAPIRFSDQQQPPIEHELVPLTENNPVKGEKIQIKKDYAFDPIELYAWFLGLNINWRGRGIFLKYEMTFPVAYPKAVKQKILASFRRGLIRSFPESLVSQSDIIAKFRVEERASEPAAYAAVALDANDIEPNEEGVSYAIFDFGGGTTDFDFGLYRWANENEDAQGYERVFEHFEPSGDAYLGGENLLENLAYLVFKSNLEKCSQNEIVFTKPLDANTFAGSELLIAKTQIAYTNTLMLMSKLRSFWQNGEQESDDVINIMLINRKGEKVRCALDVDYDQLRHFLENRISDGIQSFFLGMKKAFANNLPKEIHILLAGNSSRSRIVQHFFNINSKEDEHEHYQSRSKKGAEIARQILGQEIKLNVHPPLNADSLDESKPTAKTGVALGILRLGAGKGIKVINHTVEANEGEAPFKYYLGRIWRNKFDIGLARNTSYQQWYKIGVVTEEGVFQLYYTDSDAATEMTKGDNRLYQRKIDFGYLGDSHTVCVRAIKPNIVEICYGTSLEQIKVGVFDGLQEIIFD